jgi:hypothetical protein
VLVAPNGGVQVPVKIFSTKLTTKQIDDEEIARQLTLMHFELYQAIQPSEFLNKSWLDPHLRFKVHTPHTPHAPHIAHAALAAHTCALPTQSLLRACVWSWRRRPM